MKITLTDRIGRQITEAEGNDEVKLIMEQAYGFEDILIFEVNKDAYVEIDIDPHINKSIVFIPTGRFVYQIPAGHKKMAYHPEAFEGKKHQVTMRVVSSETLSTRRNLAMNGLDTRWGDECFPHAYANVVTRDEAWFEGKNAIDGYILRDGHGAWPYQSWGGGLRDDLAFTLDFGREVIIDEIIIYLRADYVDNHDIHWESGMLLFSDGENMAITMKKTGEGQSFKFKPKKTSSIRLDQLKREVSIAFSALSQIEVYGVEV